MVDEDVAGDDAAVPLEPRPEAEVVVLVVPRAEAGVQLPHLLDELAVEEHAEADHPVRRDAAPVVLAPEAGGEPLQLRHGPVGDRRQLLRPGYLVGHGAGDAGSRLPLQGGDHAAEPAAGHHHVVV